MKNLIFLSMVALMLAGCGGQAVVLLPDLDGHVGQVTVTPHDGQTVTLDKPLQAVGSDNKPYTMTDAQLQRTFGGALAAQPEPTAKFILHFFNDSNKIKPEDKPLLSDIMRAYVERASTDVSIIGHTDAVGDKKYNYDLSLRRALAIKAALEAEGMSPDHIQTISHGEENPLVPSPDGKSEPRNRRVEVRVR